MTYGETAYKHEKFNIVFFVAAFILFVSILMIGLFEFDVIEIDQIT